MLKAVLQFVISGLIVVLADWAAPKFGQKWAGLIVAAPLLTLLTFIFLSLDASNGSLRPYLSSALLFMIPAAVFIGCLLVLAGRVQFIISILVSFVAFALIVLGMNALKLA